MFTVNNKVVDGQVNMQADSTIIPRSADKGDIKRILPIMEECDIYSG